MSSRAFLALLLATACSDEEPNVQPDPPDPPVCASDDHVALELRELSAPVTGTRVWQEGGLESSGFVTWSASLVDNVNDDCDSERALLLTDSRVQGDVVTIFLRLSSGTLEAASTTQGTGGWIELGGQDTQYTGRFSITTASGRPLEGVFIANGSEWTSCDLQSWGDQAFAPIRARLAAAGKSVVDCFSPTPQAVLDCVEQAEADGNGFVTGWPDVPGREFIGAPDERGVYQVDGYIANEGDQLGAGDSHALVRCADFTVDPTCTPWDASCFACTTVSSTLLCEEAS